MRRVRVVDLRASAPASEPTLQAFASGAAELLRAMGTLLARQPDQYDVGAARIEQVRAAMPDDLLAAIEGFGDRDHKTFLVLSVIAATLPRPAGVEELLAALDEDPELTWRLLVGHNLLGWDAVEEPVPQRVAAGDPDALARVRRLGDEPGCPEKVRALLTHDPVDHGRTVADLVRRFRDSVWEDLEAEAMGPIQRDVTHRRAQLEAGVPLEQVVLEATNGYELDDDPEVHRVQLLPSYWMRPWLVIGRIGDVEVLSTPVADEFLALPSEAPPPTLLKLFKALADEGRLQLLRRMSAGPIRLGDAVDVLGVTKATAHHHLSILRQAGLVSLRKAGRDTHYALREDPPEVARDALARYVPRRR
jgi:DNA-binding transcriptional ArsR family regulator